MNDNCASADAHEEGTKGHRGGVSSGMLCAFFNAEDIDGEGEGKAGS